MGSPISVVLADITMQGFEETALSKPPYQPLFWKRYVDDIITAIPVNCVGAFLNYLNSVNENIQFTYEMEKDLSIPYLDLVIRRQTSGHLQFSVFRKSTHTDQYLNANSYNPMTHKIATASTLFRPAETHCSIGYKDTEVEKVKQSLALNGYGNNFI